MMIIIKTEEEIARIRKACKIVAKVLQNLKNETRPGITTAKLDKIGEERILSLGGQPAFKGYRGYKYSTCLSVNNEVVHGLPSERALKEGDIIGVDVGAIFEGYYGDSAVTFPVGKVSKKTERLMSTASDCLKLAIKKVKAGANLGDIGEVIEARAKREGFSVVRDLFGHGVGKSLHEDPLIPNYGKAGEGPVLKAGMVLAIEPMVNEGVSDIVTLPDGWTVITKDGGLSAHFEHTVLVTEKGVEVLTEI